MSTLVNPEPLNIRSMERWAAFRTRVHAWPLEILRARAAELVEKHFPDDAGLRKALRRDLMKADQEGDLADALILAALRTGEIRASISYPPSPHCYALERFCWSTFFKRYDALKAIEDGVAPWPLTGFVPQSIERDLANRPLFVSKSEANAFLKLNPPSEASLKKASKVLVAEHMNTPLKKSEFIAALVKRCPGCSAHRAGKAWQAHVPAAWRRPGRRRRA